MKIWHWIALLLVLVLPTNTARADSLRLAVTTSFNNSGLSEILVPEIQQQLGIQINLLIVGTGQALRLARAGDVDAILVHSPKAERIFVEQGHALHRRQIMYNDFVLIGPSDDPAEISGASSAKEAFRKIRDFQSSFVSRGDDSGTHKKEMDIWESTGLNADSLEQSWYRSVGSGMGASLNTASGLDAYILSDRASWINFGNKANLTMLFEGDPELFNQYSYLPVNPARHPHVKSELALKLEQWLTGTSGQKLIGSYQLGGELLFTPNAKPD